MSLPSVGGCGGSGGTASGHKFEGPAFKSRVFFIFRLKSNVFLVLPLQVTCNEEESGWKNSFILAKSKNTRFGCFIKKTRYPEPKPATRVSSAFRVVY